MNAVSIIIPAFNAEKSIVRAINSCLLQSYQHCEVIAINDGSTDNTGALLKSNFSNNKNIIIINKKNEGVGKARNAGLALASGDYVYFLDADDYLDENSIQLMVEAIESVHADVAISGYKMLTGRETMYVKPSIDHDKTPLDNFIIDRIVSSPWAKLFRKSIIIENNIEFSAHKIMQDGFFNIQYFSATRSLAIVDLPLYNYDKSLSISTVGMNSEKLENIFSSLNAQKKMLTNIMSNKHELNRVLALFDVRILRLGIWFPLQSGCRDEQLKVKNRELMKNGILLNPCLGLHERLKIIALFMGYGYYALSVKLIESLKKLVA